MGKLAALEIGGVTAASADPADGIIVRDRDGEPWERSTKARRTSSPPDRDEEWFEGLRVAQAYLHSLGITAWQDANVGTKDSGYPTFEPYRTFAASGDLTARVVGALWWDRHRGIEQIDDLLDLRERGATA